MSSPPRNVSPAVASTSKSVAREVEQRAVEGASAEVVDRDALAALAPEAVGEGGRGRLVQDAKHLEAGDAPATFVEARCSSLKCAGTVMTALSTVSPSAASAICRARLRTKALISGSV